MQCQHRSNPICPINTFLLHKYTSATNTVPFSPVFSLMMERMRGPAAFQAAAAAAAMLATRNPRPTAGPALLPPPYGPCPQPVDLRPFPPGPSPFQAPLFSQEDLDMVLYGYARNRAGEQITGHALSGLRIGELSYGKRTCQPFF